MACLTLIHTGATAMSGLGHGQKSSQREHNESAFPPKAAVKADMRI